VSGVSSAPALAIGMTTTLMASRFVLAHPESEGAHPGGCIVTVEPGSVAVGGHSRLPAPSAAQPSALVINGWLALLLGRALAARQRSSWQPFDTDRRMPTRLAL